jgi:DNA-binding MarR family transcriptional regulator
MEIDKIIHEPARLRIMMILAGLEQADFNFLLKTLSLTRGNLSRHVEKLESAAYLKVKKSPSMAEFRIPAINLHPKAPELWLNTGKISTLFGD